MCVDGGFLYNSLSGDYGPHIVQETRRTPRYSMTTLTLFMRFSTNLSVLVPNP
ncbi:hypothetical protein SAMN05421823_10229 [Catalinimonas alkaloidigena]|uniref:Uncharacterized protein n=1 Tax=Catalinimonas alkaloidigena TaxID=1075417 RepID=A0A1G8ZM07_9BACT|nr:hypothetical protein SAMN05421823_10229 [Catalinimonas alkaloidigena]